MDFSAIIDALSYYFQVGLLVFALAAPFVLAGGFIKDALAGKYKRLGTFYAGIIAGLLMSIAFGYIFVNHILPFIIVRSIEGMLLWG